MTDRLEQLRSLLAEEPGDSFLRYAIALELKRLQRTDEAMRDLEALLKDQPAHVPSYYQLALMLAEAGRPEEAATVCDAGALQCLVAGDRKTRAELIGLKDTLDDLAE